MAGKGKTSDGWVLFEAWCKSKGGTPIRGGGGVGHTCYIGPLPDDTIVPEDYEEDDVNIFDFGDLDSNLVSKVKEYRLKSAELKFEGAKLRLEMEKNRISKLKSKPKKASK
jgi:hypothetical protein